MLENVIDKFINELVLNNENESLVGMEFKTKSRHKRYYVYTNDNRNIMTKPVDGQKQFSQPIPVIKRYLETGMINTDNDSSYIIPIGDYIKTKYLNKVSNSDLIEIKIGKFITEHLDNIIKYCHINESEIAKLKDINYSGKIFDIAYSFMSNISDITEEKNKRYWKSEYLLNNSKVRFCSQFGSSKIRNEGKTISQEQGEYFYQYLSERSLLAEKYKNKNIKFIVGSENINTNVSFINTKISGIKNIILYGPPGVGKTHNYQRIISEIESDIPQNKIFQNIKENEKIILGSEAFQKIKDEGRVEFVTFHQSYSYEDFIEGFRPTEDGSIKLEDGIFKEMVEAAKSNLEKNYYLVIDEINRGNISKIFGELITLIEEDKRDVYEVTLPYSKEKFKIPSNLYIIATMNSTDKSIATIDIALRRRFTFLKMKPNIDLILDERAKELFTYLNVFIKDTLGEDYMLGHSYFMKINSKDDLEFVKEYKIRPLLEEYFYADDENFEKANSILEQV